MKKARRPSRFHLVQEAAPMAALAAAGHSVFVYGSLLPGLHNHGLLRGAAFLGYHTTRPAFDMYSLGSYPAVCAGGTTAVTGGLFRVDADTLAALDQLESHPSWYKREPVEIPSAKCKAWMYVMPRTEMSFSRSPEVPGGDWEAYYRSSCSTSDTESC